MIGNKVKALLNLKGKLNKDLLPVLNVTSPQSLNTKYKRDSFFASDLIKIADFLGCELCFIDKRTGETLVKFNIDDTKKDIDE